MWIHLVWTMLIRRLEYVNRDTGGWSAFELSKVQSTLEEHRLAHMANLES